MLVKGPPGGYLHPTWTDRAISAETSGLDDVFPPGDMGSGPETNLMLKYILWIYISNEIFRRDMCK